MNSAIALLSIIVLLSTTISDLVVGSRKQFKVHWNTSNPIFRIDNTDNVIDINKGNAAWEHDQVHIVCPFYRTGGTSGVMDNVGQEESYIIYNVNKEEYDTCRILNPVPRFYTEIM